MIIQYKFNKLKTKITDSLNFFTRLFDYLIYFKIFNILKMSCKRPSTQVKLNRFFNNKKRKASYRKPNHDVICSNVNYFPYIGVKLPCNKLRLYFEKHM